MGARRPEYAEKSGSRVEREKIHSPTGGGSHFGTRFGKINFALIFIS
jgi:hypothetical protein